MMPSFLHGRERNVGAVFMAGAAAQIALVLLFSVIFRDLRRALWNSLKFGTIPAWGAAIIAVSIHATTIASSFWMNRHGSSNSHTATCFCRSRQRSTVGRRKFFSAVMSSIVWHVAGCLTRRKLRLSALLFAAIHIGYVGPDFLSFLWPMLGTAVLGAFFAWSALLARGELLPVVVCHAALIAVIQPWLALAR
jgi:hypothetical protein